MAILVFFFQVIEPFIKELVTPIFPSFNDQNPNVRYYATEALCNVCRVSRAAILNLIGEIFSIIIQLSMETDQNMKSATELLDRVMKVNCCNLGFVKEFISSCHLVTFFVEACFHKHLCFITCRAYLNDSFICD